jgi:hypothetical protein
MMEASLLRGKQQGFPIENYRQLAVGSKMFKTIQNICIYQAKIPAMIIDSGCFFKQCN